jgi:hypothetical protein
MIRNGKPPAGEALPRRATRGTPPKSPRRRRRGACRVAGACPRPAGSRADTSRPGAARRPRARAVSARAPSVQHLGAARRADGRAAGGNLRPTSDRLARAPPSRTCARAADGLPGAEHAGGVRPLRDRRCGATGASRAGGRCALSGRDVCPPSPSGKRPYHQNPTTTKRGRRPRPRLQGTRPAGRFARFRPFGGRAPRARRPTSLPRPHLARRLRPFPRPLRRRMAPFARRDASRVPAPVSGRRTAAENPIAARTGRERSGGAGVWITVRSRLGRPV